MTEAIEWDATAAEMAGIGRHLRETGIPTEAMHAAKQRIIDTLGCGLGGWDSPPARVARSVATAFPTARGARVLGSPAQVSPDDAAFANTIMSRYLDFNDMNPVAVSMGHPSDAIPGILAMAETVHAPGTRVLEAVVIAYQAFSAMPVRIKPRGWDQSILVAYGVAAGVGALLDFDEERQRNAISLALTPNLALEVTRRGSLSMWKACATAAASRTAVYATRLAADGMTGPPRPFEGEHGLWEQATGDFELQWDPRDVGFRVQQSQVKCFPADGSSQPVLWTLLEMTDHLTSEQIESIERIDLRTHWGLWFETGREPEKWDPRTRETADHSQPYLMATALRQRQVTPASFEESRFLDPSIRPLMKKISISEDPELTARRPPDSLSDIEIWLADGQHLAARTGLPRGDHRNPMTDDEISAKFRGMSEVVSTAERSDALLTRLWEMENAPDIGPLMALWAAMPTAKGGD